MSVHQLPPGPTSTLAERLHWALDRSPLEGNQSALARAVNLSQPSVNGLMTGTTKRTRYLAQIASVLQVAPEWLATGKGAPTPWQGVPPDMRELAKLIAELPEDEQRQVAEFVAFLRARIGTEGGQAVAQ